MSVKFGQEVVVDAKQQVIKKMEQTERFSGQLETEDSVMDLGDGKFYIVKEISLGMVRIECEKGRGYWRHASRVMKYTQEQFEKDCRDEQNYERIWG
jgi:hypothetical protein